MPECTKVCLSGTVAPESANTPPKTNKFKTKQQVAYLKVRVGENHKLEASLGYTVRPGLSEQSFELITITRGQAYSSLSWNSRSGLFVSCTENNSYIKSVCFWKLRCSWLGNTLISLISGLKQVYSKFQERERYCLPL